MNAHSNDTGIIRNPLKMRSSDNMTVIQACANSDQL